jgi:hypothetical protein
MSALHTTVTINTDCCLQRFDINYILIYQTKVIISLELFEHKLFSTCSIRWT